MHLHIIKFNGHSNALQEANNSNNICVLSLICTVALEHREEQKKSWKAIEKTWQLKTDSRKGYIGREEEKPLRGTTGTSSLGHILFRTYVQKISAWIYHFYIFGSWINRKHVILIIIFNCPLMWSVKLILTLKNDVITLKQKPVSVRMVLNILIIFCL